MSSVRRDQSRPSKLFTRRRKSAARARILLPAEQLELRQLMAGDVNPYHNNWYAQDVNNDYVSTPLDALMVINALNSGGARKLIGEGADNPQGEEGNKPFIDVDGDGYLTPKDALSIINHLNAGGEAPIAVRLRTILYDENGREITDPTKRSGSGTVADPYVYTLSKNDRFGVSVQETDLRPQGPANGGFDQPPLGVYGLWTDLAFDPSKVSLGYSEIQQFQVSNIVDTDGFAQIRINVPGFANPTDPINLRRPGFNNSNSANDRLQNAANIEDALNTLTGSIFNDVFRVSVITGSGAGAPAVYSIKFLGDYVNRDVGLINVTPVAGQQTSITIDPVSTTFAPVDGSGNLIADLENTRANILGAVNLNTTLFQALVTGNLTVDDYYTVGANLGVIGRTGGWGGSLPSIENDRTVYSPPEENDGYIELIRPYFVAHTATGSTPIEFSANPAGFYSGDPTSQLSITQTLVLGAAEEGQSVDGSVPVESTDYGAPIRIIIRADVTAGADNVSVNEDAVNAPISVLGNDTNNVGVTTPIITGIGIDGKQTSYTVPGQGTVTWNGTALLFTPVANYFGTFSFQYGLTDTGTEPKDFGQVTITVTEVNDNPTADDDTVTIVEDSNTNVITSQLLQGDSVSPDPAGSETLTITAVNGLLTSPTSKGTVTVSGGVVTYTPNQHATGADSFTYTLSDSRGGSSTATVTINITNVNDPPSFNIPANHSSNEDGGAQSVAGFVSSVLPGPATANPPETGTVTLSINLVTPSPTLTFTAAPQIAPDGTLTYHAAPNAYGTAIYSITATDNDGATTTTPFSIIVNPQNDAPEFTIPTTLTKNEDQSVNEAFASAITAGPNEGTAGVTFTVNVTGTTGNLAFQTAPQVAPNGTLTYVPSANTFGTATIEVIASDGSLQTTKSFTLTVSPVNDAPTGVDDSGSAMEAPDDATTALPVLSNDTFAPDVGETLLVDTAIPLEFLDTPPAGVVVTVAPDGSGLQVYSPPNLISGSLRVRYTLRDRAQGDATGLTSTAVATITFVSNELPRAVADPDLGPVLEDDTNFTRLNVLANDRADGAGVLAITGVRFIGDSTFALIGETRSDAAGNTLRFNADGTLDFRPGLNVDSDVQFEYEVNQTPATPDGPSTTISRVLVTKVNDVPVVTPPASPIAGFEDNLASPTAFVINLADYVEDVETADAQLVFVVGNAINGTVSVNNGIATFIPAANYFGPASFTFTVTDVATGASPANTTTPATVNLDVQPVNDAPTMVPGSDVVVNEDAVGNITGWYNPASISAGPANEAGQIAQIVSINTDNNGLFTSGPALDASGNLTFTLTPEASGEANVTITLQDDGGTANNGSDTRTYTFKITVNNVNDAPTFTKGVDQQVAEAQTAIQQVVPNWIVASSTGAPNETQGLRYEITSAPNALFSVQPTVGADGTLRYTPAATANGTATISLRIVDDGGTPGNPADDAFSDVQTFNITVTPVNTPPVITPGSPTVVENRPSAPQSITIDLRTLVSDVETLDDALTYDVTGVTNGAVVRNGFDLTFTPNPNFNGVASFSLTALDTGDPAGSGTGAGAPLSTGPVVVNIVVTPVNDAPVAAATSASTPEDPINAAAQYTIDLRTLVTDTETTTGFTFSVSNPVNGTVSLDADGFTARFVPTLNYNGAASFRYTVTDGGDNAAAPLSASNTVSLTITAVNDPPTANDDPDVRVFKTETSLDLTNLLANDTIAPDANETLTIVSVTITSAVPGDAGSPPNTSLGATVINSGTGVRFTNPNGFYGTVTLTYTIRDTGGLEDTATVKLNVVNFLPGFISGTVWVDGGVIGQVEAGERRISGVEVYLYGTTMFGEAYSLTATTDASGQYLFRDSTLPNGGVIPGTYTVSLDNPNTAAIEGAELFTDGADYAGTVTGTNASSTRIANNTYRVIFGENGATVTGLSFSMQSLQSNYINIRDHLASSSPNGAVFGASIGATAAATDQYWSMMLDSSWNGMHDLKIKISPDLTTATIEGRDTNNVFFTKTLSFATDYTKIRLMGRDGNNAVVRLIGTASDFFPTADLVASSLPGPQGEAVYYSEEGAEYAVAADAVYAEESWA